MKSKKKIVSTSFALLMALGGISAFMPKSYADSANEANTEMKAEEKEILTIKKRDDSNKDGIFTITIPKEGFVKNKAYHVKDENDKATLPEGDGFFTGKVLDSEDKEVGFISTTPKTASITFKEVDGLNKFIKDGVVELKLRDVKGVSDATTRDKFFFDMEKDLKLLEDSKMKANKSFEAYKNSENFDKAIGEKFNKSVKDADLLVEKAKSTQDYNKSLIEAKVDEFLKYDLYFKEAINKDSKDLDNAKKTLDESSKKLDELKSKGGETKDPDKKEDEKQKVDKSKLKEIIDEGHTYDTSKLSEENQKLLKEALAKLEKVYNDENAGQEEVDNLVRESLDIKKNLGLDNKDSKEDEKDPDKKEENKVDKTKLEDQIKKFDDMDLAKYNKEGQDKINELKKEAVNLFNKEDLTEEEISVFLKKVENTDLSSYEMKEEEKDPDKKDDSKEKEVIDRTPVKDIIDKLDNLELGLYNKEGLDKISDLKNKAVSVFNNDKSTKEDVDKIVKDYEELSKNLDSYKAKKEEDKKEDKKNDKKDDKKNKVEVKVTPDKTKLKDAISKLDNLNLSSYSKEKQDEILKVKADALKVYNNDKATEEEIEKAIKDVNAVLDKTAGQKVDKTALKTAIDDLNKVDVSKLSDAEKTKYNTVKDNALKVYNNDKATEEEVKKALKDIEDFKKEAKLVKDKDGKFVKETVDKGGKGALPQTGQGLLPYIVGTLSAIGGGFGIYKYKKKK